jgi:phospholipase A1
MTNKAVGSGPCIRWRFLLLYLLLHPLPVTWAQTNLPSATGVAEVSPTDSGKPPFDPVAFFLRHVSPYEPIYFVAGSESPNAKFQIGFKYQLMSDDGWLSTHASMLQGFHLAYMQTSLWDLSSPSAPFFDSSYKPEFLYLWERIAGRKPGDWFRLDLQGGVQHESNGKGGADSRSLNIAYVRPTLAFGGTNDFRFALQPRVWSYLGDLSDNPDLAEYRGYFDLRATIAWRDLQLSAFGRMGKDGENHSVQFDLTYPCPWTSIYLHAQYFTGYGESLLRYRQRSDVFRFGISLYR